VQPIQRLMSCVFSVHSNLTIAEQESSNIIVPYQ
jgi:hypothetical protein